MKSFRLGKLLGISVELHSTFLLLIIALILFLAIFSPQSLLSTAILFFFLFFSVLLHELVHSVVAVNYGLKVERIVLTPIGGVALTEDQSTRPSKEFVIALSGPLFNFLVAFVAWLLALVVPGLAMPPPNVFFSESALENAILQFPLFGLLYVNLILGAFNLFVPALPMDGGRVLRSVLSMVLGAVKATQVASTVSKALAAIMVLVGLFGQPLLLIIGIFVFFGAGMENEMVLLRETLKGETIRRLVKKNPPVVEASMPLGLAFKKMLACQEPELFVKAPKAIGVISIEGILETRKEALEKKTVAEAMQKVKAFSANSRASEAMIEFASKGVSILPVMQGKRLAGYVERSDLEQLYRLKKSLLKMR